MSRSITPEESMTGLEEQNLLQKFREKNALLEGHFLLSSGLHSDRYLQSALLLQHPEMAQALGESLAQKFRSPVDVVLSPAMGGIVIGHEVARAKGSRSIFSEKNEEGKPILRRGFFLTPQDRVLVVEDVITTGLSTLEVIALVELAKAQLVGVGSIVNRSGGRLENILNKTKNVCSLLTLEVKTWAKESCPLCAKGVSVEKPGSRKQ